MGMFWERYHTSFGCHEIARELGYNSSQKTLPQCNPTQHRPSLKRNLKMANTPVLF